MSAILSADDLNDFISPGVACIKPVETFAHTKPEDEQNPYEVTTEDKAPQPELPKAQISLTDCLACSGCVTSAEAVLVSLQSHAEVLSALDSAPSLKLESIPDRGALGNNDGSKIFVASVSPQTRASLAATYGLTEEEAGNMLEHLLSGPSGLRSGGSHGSGFTWVFDTNLAREACLVLGAGEALDAADQKASRITGATSVAQKRPILTSACPGWVCYAEKTHPHVLPHLSQLKSPQALMGTLLKTVLSRKLGVSPDRIWHLAIMPCFDKKLEASREELTDAYWQDNSDVSGGVRDVDCVITTKEIPLLAAERGISLPNLPRTRLPQTEQALFPDTHLQGFLSSSQRQTNHNGDPVNGSSGGYLYHIMQTLQTQHPGSQISISRGRNADVLEYLLLPASASPETQPIFKAARYYGFRNIQNLVRRLKPPKASRLPGGRAPGASRKPGTNGPAANTSEYGYVEVMACPGGCTNGGAQIGLEEALALRDNNQSTQQQLESKPGLKEQKAWLAAVDEAYFSSDESESTPSTPSSLEDQYVNGVNVTYVRGVLHHWSTITGIPISKLAYTSFREVESDVGKGTDKSAGRETDRVVELAGKIGGGW